MSEPAAQALLHLVATPIGNLEDMSHRAVRVLGEAAVIACEDTRSALRLMSHFAIKGPRLVSFFDGNEAERSEELVAELRAGRRVAVISDAGSPGLSDPGQRLVERAVAAGIRVEVVPGPAAAIVALTGSGLPTAAFLFLGFPPRAPGARQEGFGQLRGQAATLVFYESPERVAATLADLAAALGDDRRAVVARELTKRFEEYVRGTLGELAARFAAEPPRGECTLVVEGGAETTVIDVEAELGRLLATGMGPKEAAQRLVVVTGKPRRQLYQLALALRERAR